MDNKHAWIRLSNTYKGFIYPINLATYLSIWIDSKSIVIQSFNVNIWHQNVAKETTEKVKHFPARSGHGYPQASGSILQDLVTPQ